MVPRDSRFFSEYLITRWRGVYYDTPVTHPTMTHLWHLTMKHQWHTTMTDQWLTTMIYIDIFQRYIDLVHPIYDPKPWLKSVPWLRTTTSPISGSHYPGNEAISWLPSMPLQSLKYIHMYKYIYIYIGNPSDILQCSAGAIRRLHSFDFCSIYIFINIYAYIYMWVCVLPEKFMLTYIWGFYFNACWFRWILFVLFVEIHFDFCST